MREIEVEFFAGTGYKEIVVVKVPENCSDDELCEIINEKFEYWVDRHCLSYWHYVKN